MMNCFVANQYSTNSNSQKYLFPWEKWIIYGQKVREGNIAYFLTAIFPNYTILDSNKIIIPMRKIDYMRICSQR